MTDEKTELTEGDKIFIKKNWDKIPLIEITRTVSGNPNADGRTTIGKAINKYIVELGGEPITTKYSKIALELTKDQESFIESNYKNSKPLEMARLLFPDKKGLTNLNKETVLVQQYVKKIDPEAVDEKDELSVSAYRAPQSIKTLMPKVTKYITRFSVGDVKPPDIENLTEQERKQLNALLSYINTYRFISQINRYKIESDREIFESSFIRYTYDKPDLMEEDIDQYIVVCDEIVAQGGIQATIELLNAQIQEALESEGGASTIKQNVVELINAQREKLNVSRKRVDDIVNKLVSSRATRLKNRQVENASILNLVEAWKEEKERLKIIEVAERQKERESEEIDKISTMDDVMILVAGFPKERARH